MYDETKPTYWEIVDEGFWMVIDATISSLIFIVKMIFAPLLFPFYLIGKFK